MKLLLYLFFFLLPSFLLQAQKIITIDVDGTINPAAAGYIQRAIKTAEEQKAQCLLIRLNTPGGLLKSTRVIVSQIMASTVPVAVYVAPDGAHAGSAGVFITMAAHVAAMAPGTNIGAAHPVSLQGGGDTTMAEKTTNDAVAFIRTIAQKRGRNGAWAEMAVRKSVSETATDAQALNIIDFVSTSTEQLLQQMNGKTVAVGAGTKAIQTTGAVLAPLKMSLIERLLSIISDPNIAYLLMMLGFYGILFELYSPGTLVPGIIGAISLILAFYALHTLPLNYAGLALIVLGIVLLILEISITSYGMLTVGGILCLLLGSMMLIRTDPSMAFLQISKSVIIAATLVTALFFLFVIGAGIKAQKAKAVTGMEGFIHETGETMETLNPEGPVLVHGEIWQAESVAGTIEKGKKIRIVDMKSFKLFVEPLS